MITEIDENGKEIHLGTTADIADLLRVPRARVRNWYRYQHLYQFPDPVGVRLLPSNGLRAKHWDLDRVQAWHLLADGHVMA